MLKKLNVLSTFASAEKMRIICTVIVFIDVIMHACHIHL